MLDLYYLAVAAFDRPTPRSRRADAKVEEEFYRSYGEDPLARFKRLWSRMKPQAAKCSEPSAQEPTKSPALAETIDTSRVAGRQKRCAQAGLTCGQEQAA